MQRVRRERDFEAVTQQALSPGSYSSCRKRCSNAPEKDDKEDYLGLRLGPSQHLHDTKIVSRAVAAGRAVVL